MPASTTWSIPREFQGSDRPNGESKGWSRYHSRIKGSADRAGSLHRVSPDEFKASNSKQGQRPTGRFFFSRLHELIGFSRLKRQLPFAKSIQTCVMRSQYITAVCSNVRCPASGAANVRPKKNIGASMTNMRPCDPDMMLCAGDKLRSKLQGKGISIEVALEKLETCLHIPRNHVKQFRSTFLQISTIASRNHIEQSISTVVYATLVHRWLQ